MNDEETTSYHLNQRRFLGTRQKTVTLSDVVCDMVAEVRMDGEPVNFSYGLDTLATRGGRIEELVPLLESLKREHAAMGETIRLLEQFIQSIIRKYGRQQICRSGKTFATEEEARFGRPVSA